MKDWETSGCLKCFCWSHNNVNSNCSSADGFYLAEQADAWSLLDGLEAIQDPWMGTDQDDKPLTVENPTVFPGDVKAQ